MRNVIGWGAREKAVRNRFYIHRNPAFARKKAQRTLSTSGFLRVSVGYRICYGLLYRRPFCNTILASNITVFIIQQMKMHSLLCIHATPFLNRLENSPVG